MKTWVNKTLLTRRLIVPVMAVALALSFTTYEFIKPAYAKGPVASPTATPLDTVASAHCCRSTRPWKRWPRESRPRS